MDAPTSSDKPQSHRKAGKQRVAEDKWREPGEEEGGKGGNVPPGQETS